MSRNWHVGVTTLFAASHISCAGAQTYTVDSISSWSIGTVAAAASGNTVFLNSADGYVNVISGAGSVLSGPYAYETVSIRCVDQGGNLCSNTSNKARIRVGRTGVKTGRGQTVTTIGVYNGTATVGAGTNETNSIVDVPLSGWTATNQVLTFRISCYWPIAGDDSGVSTGAASSQFYVYAAANPTIPTAGLNGTITATVRRALTLTKVNDLRFGTIISPTSGTNYVAVDTSGNRGQADGSGNYGAGTVILVPSNYGPAQFTASGEPGTTFSLTVPGSMTMSGPGGSISVTLTPSPASGSQTLSAGGTLSLATGGYFPVSAGLTSGNYSGSFVVTVAYN